MKNIWNQKPSDDDDSDTLPQDNLSNLSSVSEDSESDDNNKVEQRVILFQNFNVGKDGTVWSPPPTGKRPGPVRESNVFRNATGPTGFAKRTVQSQALVTTFRLIIDISILRIMKSCTEAEAARRGEMNWSIDFKEIGAFLAIMYYRGLLGAKNLPLKDLWDGLWGSNFV
jgi:hypothetical protein